ncbi:uncharacterized protein LOC109608478 isoform X2 [Aethina tumida]|nr:uncharacterized protein LOC109608478 isoform X2 [Aethina tumida]
MSDCPTLSRCSEICVPDIQCMSYHAYTSDYKDTYYSAKFFKPQCLDDGSWAPKQCKGGKTGRCFCFDGDGKRIFGEALYDESEDMTCACSRRKVELIQAGIRNYVFFHCDSKGNYEKLQCDRDHCWCVEPKTGELNSTVVPKTAMKYLPCYSSLIVGNQYLRQCESEKYAQEMIIEELKYHGVEHTNFRYLICDGDGAFGAFNVSNSRPYCTWRDGSLIGSYQGNDMNEVLTINCNCARDNKRYGLNSECIYNGNYAETQYIQSTSQFYCVDADGFAKSDPYSSGTHVNCRDFY